MIARALATIGLVAASMAAVPVPDGAQQAAPAPPRPARVGIDEDRPLPITLEEAIRRAVDRNGEVELARLDTDIAAEGVRVAQGAFDLVLIPAVTLQRAVNASASALGGATEGRVEQTLASGTAQLTGRTRAGGGRFWVDFASSRLTTSNQFSRLNPQFPATVALTYQQPLLRGRGIDAERRALRLSRSAVTRSHAELTRTVIDQLTLVELAYWELVFARRNLDVQLAALAQAQAQVASNERQAREGTLAPIEVIEASTQVATFRQAVASAEQTLTEAENELKTLTLADRTAPEWRQPFVPTTPDDPRLPDWTLDAAVTLALANRPELSVLTTAVEDNAVERDYFRDLSKPQFDLTGSLSFAGLAGGALADTGETVPPFLVGGYGSSLGNLFARRFPTAALQVQIELPIENTTARANLARTQLTATQLQRRRAQIEQVIEADVRNAMQAAAAARERLDAAASASRGAQEQYESERRRFESGLSTVFLVLERQAALVTAQGRELRARTDLNQAIARLERAVGVTMERHGIQRPAAPR